MTNRTSFMGKFTGNVKGLKTAARAFVEERGIYCVSGSFTSPEGFKSTNFLMEGESISVSQIQLELAAMLTSKFPSAAIGIIVVIPHWLISIEWQEQLSDSPLVQSAFLPNPNPLSRESSGDVGDDIPNDANGKWPDFFTAGFTQALQLAQTAHRIASVAHSSASNIAVKDICATYNNVTVHLNIGSCLTWNQFIVKVRQDSDLQLTGKDVRIYEETGGKRRYIKEDVLLLKDGVEYFVETCEKKVRS